MHRFPVATVVAALALTAAPANAYDWKAEPAWIANAGVYRDHEFVYQDYLYDDHGANTDGFDHIDLPFGAAGPDTQTPTDPRLSPAPAINWAGDFTYPSANGTHVDNVADLQELRVAADKDAVHYRFKLGTMTAPDSTVVALCVDEDGNRSTGIQTWPHGANVVASLGCDHFYTLYGTGVGVMSTTGVLGGSASADPAKGYLELTVPRSVADPGDRTWRLYVAAGVWDAAGQKWAAPTPVPSQQGLPVATGGSPSAPNIYDLLSNNDEPNSTWNEENQANDLARVDLSGDYVDVDFGRMKLGFDDPDPRRTGVVERIHVSDFVRGNGKGLEISRGLGVQYEYNGAWQPYVAVIPSTYYQEPFKAWPYDQCLHPLGANHNVEVYYGEALAKQNYTPATTGARPETGYLGTSVITRLIDRLGAVYSCVLGRGEGIGFTGRDGTADALEVARDMQRHYRTDPDRTFVHGVSLGAIGSWAMSTAYPDRFAAVMPYIYTGSSGLVGNLYNLPVFFSIGTGDEFGQGAQGDSEADALEDAGVEYVYLHYLGRQHEGRIEADVLPFVEQLAYAKVRVRNPARVKFQFDRTKYPPQEPGDGSAYWVRGMAPRSGNVATIDAVSLARADELPTHQVVFDGEYANVPKNYRARIRGLLRVSDADFATVWRPAAFEPGWQELNIAKTGTDLPRPAVSNGFTMTSTALGSVALDTGRMKLDDDDPITGTIDGDGATTLTLLGHFDRGTDATIDGVPVASSVHDGDLTVTIPSGHHVLTVG